MRKSWLLAILIAAAVAVSSRAGEYLFRRFISGANSFADYIGMSIAGITAAVLVLLWQHQSNERIRLTRERERVFRHLHHHIRNSLQVIAYRTDDEIVRENVSRIVRELEYALPGNGKRMPQPDDPHLEAFYRERE